MGVSISTKKDPVNRSVDNGGEHIILGEGDSNPIKEKESIEKAKESLEVVNSFSESSNGLDQSFSQIKDRSLILHLPTSELDQKGNNHNDDISGELAKNDEELKESEFAPKVSETDPAREQNTKTSSLMQNVFSMLGISKKTKEDDESTPTELDEGLPQHQKLPHMEPVTESLDENTINRECILDNQRIQLGQSSEEEEKNLMRITGEFPRFPVLPIFYLTFFISGFIAKLIPRKLESAQHGSRKTSPTL